MVEKSLLTTANPFVVGGLVAAAASSAAEPSCPDVPPAASGRAGPDEPLPQPTSTAAIIKQIPSVLRIEGVPFALVQGLPESKAREANTVRPGRGKLPTFQVGRSVRFRALTESRSPARGRDTLAPAPSRTDVGIERILAGLS